MAKQPKSKRKYQDGDYAELAREIMSTNHPSRERTRSTYDLILERNDPMATKAFYEGVKFAEQNPRMNFEDAFGACPYEQHSEEMNDWMEGFERSRDLHEIEDLRADPSQLTEEETHEVYDKSEEYDE